MSKRCAYCEKILKHETSFMVEAGEICEDCYNVFRQENLNGAYKVKGHIRKDVKNEEYMESFDYGNEGTNSMYEREDAYSRSGTSVWADSLKVTCYVVWTFITVIFAVTGYVIGTGTNHPLLGSLLLGMLGFFIGFISIAVIMLFIATSENIAIMTDNTAEILRMIEENVQNF